jgi:hypothetical protein
MHIKQMNQENGVDFIEVCLKDVQEDQKANESSKSSVW